MTVPGRHEVEKETNLPPLQKLECECGSAAATGVGLDGPKGAIKPLPRRAKACITTFHAITTKMGTDKGSPTLHYPYIPFSGKQQIGLTGLFQE